MFFVLEKEVDPIYQNLGRIKWKDSYHENFFYAIRNAIQGALKMVIRSRRILTLPVPCILKAVLK